MARTILVIELNLLGNCVLCESCSSEFHFSIDPNPNFNHISFFILRSVSKLQRLGQISFESITIIVSNVGEHSVACETKSMYFYRHYIIFAYRKLGKFIIIYLILYNYCISGVLCIIHQRLSPNSVVPLNVRSAIGRL